MQQREITMYPVYARERILGETAVYLIDWNTRQIWLDQGAIEIINDGTAVRLKLNLPPKPQASVTTRGIPDGIVMGLGYARAILAAWTPRDRVVQQLSHLGRAA